MKRFKDSKQINNLVIAAAPTPPPLTGKLPKDPGFLNFKLPLFLWDTKFKSLGLDSTGAPILDADASNKIQAAVAAVLGKKGLDEQIATGVQLVGGVTGTGFAITKILASQSPEWAYLIPAVGIATALSALYIHLKPGIRRDLIKSVPHIEDTLKNIQTKQYLVEETVGKRAPTVKPYTLPQIAAQLANTSPDGGRWTQGNIVRQFKNADDVDKINLMLKHQKLSDIRDALMSAGAIPSSAVATALGYGIGLAIYAGAEQERQQAFQAAASDTRVKEDPTPASKSELTRDMIKVPGYGFQKYTETRELKNGITEYFVPVPPPGKWYRKGN